MQATRTPGKFEIRYGQTIEVKVEIGAMFPFIGVVNGKLKGIDAWVVEIDDGYYWQTRKPNRHLELEWGHYSGKECESIVLAEEIVGVQ